MFSWLSLHFFFWVLVNFGKEDLVEIEFGYYYCLLLIAVHWFEYYFLLLTSLGLGNLLTLLMVSVYISGIMHREAPRQ